MKKLVEWFKQSNRWKHLLGGFLIGLFADSIYGVAYASIIAGLCLEYKDRAHGGQWDWIDLGCTVVGGALGGASRIIAGLL